MKLLRNVFMAVLFLAGVFLASANTGLVELVYMPPLPLEGYGEGGRVQVPLFVLVLGSILAGVLLTGLGLFLEQMRLRITSRSLSRENDQLNREVGTLREQVEQLKAAERITSPTWATRSDDSDESEEENDAPGSVLGSTGRDDR